MDYKPLIVVLLLSTQSLAQTAFDPLTVGIGARALGMGGAYVAVAEDGDALFNNPAGLGEIDSVKFTSMAGNLLEDVNYTVLGGIYPFGNKFAAGIGYTGSFVSGIEIRDSAGTYSRKANYGNSVAFASFGKKLTEKFSLGMNVKYYFIDGTEIDSGDGRGWNLDVGLLQKGWDWLSLGVVGLNLIDSARINYQNGIVERLPLKIKAGGKAYLLGSNYGAAAFSPLELSLAADLRYDLQETKLMTTHLGVEFSPNPYLILRTGSDQNTLTGGLSFKLAGISFHYAYHPFGDNFAHFFSLAVDERGWPAEEPPDVFIGGRTKPVARPAPL